ncbi:hypothetical protein A2U01_0012967, partial [Trifolium medium]|nr:hypothetical protein [Trifolium medium]
MKIEERGIEREIEEKKRKKRSKEEKKNKRKMDENFKIIISPLIK